MAIIHSILGTEPIPQTTVVNKYKEPYDVYIGRGSIWEILIQFKHMAENYALRCTSSTYAIDYLKNLIYIFNSWSYKVRN